ncbi:MAG TPA: cytidylate kinase-like family protein, partial [Anaerolineaceae bacterium]|nr:cytidylate kinase-like family protein [Anaerolineaceae bacterium]
AAVRNIMLEMAEEGNIIILGRAGQVILSGRPDTLHVRLTAPLEVRINRVAARLSIPYEAARAQVLASDRHRKSYLKKGYQVDWNNPDLYDLMINTANVSAETAVELILHALASRFQENNLVQ